MTVNVTTDDFNANVIQAETLVLADFYATWCGPCKALSPVLHALDEKYDGKITVAKINVDDNESIAVKFGIASIPTVIFFKNGKPVDSFVGLRSDAEVEKLILKHL